MRKILLGTTAVVGAALLAPSFAAAQEAPTVRVGGYFRAYYGYTQQTSPHVTGITATGASFQTNNQGDVGVAGTTALANGQLNQGALQGGTTTAVTNGTTASTAQSARTGKSDFSTDAEIHVFVNGKTANGLSYGAVVELEFDTNEGTARYARRSQTAKTMASVDEMYAFIASPTLGQIRFGDEDGPLGGLMNVGIVTNFGTGGIYGDWQDFVIRPNRTTTSPGDIGDNTKIIYLSPQFFGFDFGASWAFNEGTGADTGCINSSSGPTCDRVFAATGSTAFGRATDNGPAKRNEYQGVVRWRGTLGGVGLAASVGYMGYSAIRDMTASGTVVKTLRDGQVYQAGLQATAYGFTLGANYMYGNTNFYYIPTVAGDKNMNQWFTGGSHTVGPFSIGANAFWGTYAGGDRNNFNTTTGALTPNVQAAAGNSNTAQGSNSQRGMRRYGWGVGANYRLAPGLDLVAEYVHHEIKEPGRDLDNQGNNGIQDRLKADVFIVGTRLAF
jgi:hypothetical protein